MTVTTQDISKEARGFSQIVVFDFDHTLYHGDSMSQLLRWLIGRNLWRAALAILATPLLALMVGWLKTRQLGIRAYIWIATVQFHGSFDLSQAIRQFVTSQQRLIRRRLLQQGLARLTKHRQAGDGVVIATGAPTELARAILRVAGHGDVAVLGTEIRLNGYRLCSLIHCHHRKKVAMLSAAGFAPITVAYSDSLADLPLLLVAHKPVVVNPKRGQIRTFIEHLPKGTPFLNWGCPRRGGHRNPVDE